MPITLSLLRGKRMGLCEKIIFYLPLKWHRKFIICKSMEGNDLGSCETIGDFEFEIRIIGKKAGFGLRSYLSLKMWILVFFI